MIPWRSGGELLVTVGWDGARAVDARVVLERPRASRVLRGHGVEEALALLPCLFALCARAQAAAVRAALAAAGGRVLAAADGDGVLREAAQEHLWRLLRDWPRAVGVAPRDDAFAAWYRRLSQPPRPARGPGEPAGGVGADLAAFVEAEVLGPDWGALAGRADLEAWAAAGTGLGAALVRALLRADGAAGPRGPAPGIAAATPGWLEPGAPLETLLDAEWAPEHEVRPVHGGAPAETGALARHRAVPLLADLLARDGRSLLARLVARLVALADVARRLASGAAGAVDAAAPEPDLGIARVETARGTLVHRVRLDQGRVAEYAVIAPTAWNFHPSGAFAQACTGLPATSEEALRAEVGRWVLAFDPCVPWQLQVRPAA